MVGEIIIGLEDGEYYISGQMVHGSFSSGKSPIFNEAGEIIGIVSVGFLVEDIQEDFKDVTNVVYQSVIVF